ncbi:MAG: T9SS type A sorting domain-containing protein, partial [Candidatus Cloacimonetes bacterium]|nr:T9SS type A sorting domain-containing protein [Candidatus Cloacimonadota bacterium]
IFNTRGQLLESITFESGSYQYQWSAEGLNSGIYFYKLESSSYLRIRKMILLQ